MNQGTVKLLNIGEVKQAKDGRSFYTAEFIDATNPFAKSVRRNFWQQFNSAGQPEWKGASPESVSKFIGKEIPGKIVCREVDTYQIDGKDRNTYTTVVLGHETEAATFKAAGHPLAKKEEAPAQAVAEAQPQGIDNVL